MDCPHLAECCPITTEFKQLEDKKRQQCSECSTDHNLWMCLKCGKLNCSRYANGHALRHYELNNDHRITISTETTSVYCYKCDNEVHLNSHQNNSLEQLRKNIIASDAELLESSLKENDNSISTASANDTRVLRSKSQKRSHSQDEEDDDDDDEELENKQSRKSSMRNQKSQEKKAVGLRNLGNTCFMNAVLQSLNNIHPFFFYIKQLPSFEKFKKNSWKDVRQSRSSKECDDVLMAEELRKILLSLNCEYDGHGRSAISPESLFLVIWKVVPRFRGYQQQDAHEFLRYMLDRLHMELLSLLPELPLKDANIGQKGRASIITCVFGGILQSEVRCLNCSTVSKKQDPFLDLSLDIPDKSLPKHLTSRRKEPVEQDTPACNIHDCLSSFVEVEELAESEQYYCNNCKDKQRSTKRFWIRRLPNVLCLHLKRFRWINFYRVKLDTDVSFPIEFLDMSDFVLHDVRDTRQSCIGSNVYDLAAVIVHHGSGAGCGHYTAFAIHKGHWFHFNDSSVQQVRSSTVAKCKPYILFYVRREVRLAKLFES